MSTRPVEVRPARPADAAAIEALYRDLVPGDANIRVAADHVAALETDPHNHLLCADHEGHVCGTAFLTLCLDPMYGGDQPYGVVENIVVLASRRGRGVGRALLSELEAIARAAHCTKLMLLSSATRTQAHAFFRRAGFDGERKRGFVRYLNRP